MNAIVVDASVAVALLAEEFGSAAARRLKNSPQHLIAPSFLLMEVANAMLRKTRRGIVPPGYAARAVNELRRSGLPELIGLETLIGSASIIAERLAHPVYDCLYLALAQREQALLATFDARMATLAQQLSIALWIDEP